MAIKTYFDVQWTGPQITVDDSGKTVSSDTSIARKSHPAMPFDSDSTVHYSHQCHRGSRASSSVATIGISIECFG